MKKLFLIIISILIFTISIKAQQRQDVVYLHNGDIIKGEIIENVPNEYIRIELLGGSILTYFYKDIKKFTREKIEKVTEQKKEAPVQTNIIMQQQQQQQQQIAPPPVSPPAIVNQSTGLTDAQKKAMYLNQKKDPATARILSFLISSAGHWYAGNGGKGLLFLGARVISFTMAANATKKPNQIIWLVNLGLFSIWEIIDAGKEVEKYNQRLYNSIYSGLPSFSMKFEPMNKVCNIPIKDGVKLNLKYHF